MFIGNVTTVMPVIPMARINAGQIPTMVKIIPSVSPINAKRTAITASMHRKIPA